MKNILLAVSYNPTADDFLAAFQKVIAAAPVPSCEIDVEIAPSDDHRDPVDPNTLFLAEEKRNESIHGYTVQIF